MTETSPVASAGLPPVGAEGDDAVGLPGQPGPGGRAASRAGIVGRRRQRAARGTARPSASSRCAGPWVTGGYYNSDDPEVDEKFHDGWLRTGDVGSIDDLGYIRLSDRAKDVIKSGGEWISSVDLENALMAHADVVEAAVIGIPDEKWGERPLASVVVREGATLTPAELREHLEQGLRQVAAARARGRSSTRCRSTSVGKFDKKVHPQVVRRPRDRGREGQVATGLLARRPTCRSASAARGRGRCGSTRCPGSA